MSSEDERERLFQLFHDLVGEALEQYADGYAVDLERRYYELADTLIAERAELKQQLAQAQADNERLRARDAEWIESHAKAVTGYAQAQAEQATMLDLLVRTRDELWTLTGPTALTDEGKAFIRAFFAAHPTQEEADGLR